MADTVKLEIDHSEGVSQRQSGNKDTNSNRLLLALGFLNLVLIVVVVILAVLLNAAKGDIDDNKKAIVEMTAMMSKTMTVTGDATAAGQSDVQPVNQVVKTLNGNQAHVRLTEGVDPSVFDGKQFQSYNLFAGSGFWTDKPNMPSARSDFQSVTVGDKVYLIGGLDSNGVTLDSLVEYDTVLERYTSLPSMPKTRHRFGAALLNKEIYVIGGFESSSSPGPEKCMLVYNIGTKEWREGACTEVPHGDTCAAELGGHVYVIGGYGVDYETLDVVEKYDPSTERWSRVESLPDPRGDVGCASMGGSLYLIGGYYSPTWDPDSFQNTNYKYDPTTNQWTKMADIPTARGDKAVVVLPNNRLLVIGGETHARGEVTQIPVHKVEMYYPEHDVWVEKASIPSARFRFTAASAGKDSIVYAFGGHVLCETGWNNDYDNPDCPNKALASVQAFYDLEHPDIFLNVGLE
mmetsp:Transcript_42536/g.51665  ORF Transcript_42536/g.51665 Transcript_42536/m.51665 type:complete len:461 (+) Transcript_42536:207-1589(+)|eukprot:CAMPEP_0197852244 /NCGR_PEP_ID=MMETSP1438-20131217/20009_1 /TAXON_ID=1461541 /ORGANISM="Pterosperma sp., Strain CCMP1384" /LENGTH=460 /DNA_ID=CAMNT_0043466179 /DNA_START=194 /DNA_END=1576 /DNA_ORIENTATION=+